MNGFRIAALTLPGAAAFLAPALWAWKQEWKIAGIGIAGLVGFVFLWGILAGAPFDTLLAVSVVSLSFSAFALELSMVAGQVVSGLAVVLLCSTLFLAPTVVEDAVKHGRPAPPRVDLLLSVNPWASLAGGPFKLDLFRDFKLMYRTQVADYADARPPAWGGVAARYAGGGILLGAAAFGVRRIRRRAPPLQSPA